MRNSQECSIGLIGQGLIYQEVQRHIERQYRSILCTPDSSPQQLATCEIVVSCCDTWSPKMLQQINQRCLQAGVALLPVYTQFGEGIIGPCVMPYTRGCSNCAELRALGAAYERADHEIFHHYLYKEGCQPLISQPWLSSFSLAILAALVEEEIAAYLFKPSQLRTGCALLTLSLETLECRRHAFLPHPSCPDCGTLPKDEADLAIITLQSRPKSSAFTYRIHQPETSAEQIFAMYVDQRTGLVNALTMEDSPLPIATSQFRSEIGNDAEEATGTGCTLRPEQSKLVSVLETVERYASLRPRSKRTVVQASYHQLVQQAQCALDPTTLGLQSLEQYEWYQCHDHCHPLVPYHHDLVCNWVWGYSFQNQAPMLVPEHYAYYGVPINAENPAFVFEVSNGCALGNCLEEALFHGIMEVAERDAFLLMWYAQLKLPRLNLLSVTDPLIRLLVEHLEYHSGYTIYALNATLDHAIPCLCLLGIDEQNREGMPKAHVVAGSHPHPEQALLRGLRELATMLVAPSQVSQEDRIQALEMLADSNLVHTMDHHPLVYYLPEAFDRLHCFLRTPQQQTFQEAFADFYRTPPERMNLRDDLDFFITYYLKRGIDVIVIDQAAPEPLPGGLHCVKVIMPGLLPMTFGQQNRRIVGFKRLHQLPFTLGYQDHPLTEAEINPYPHPFF